MSIAVTGILVVGSINTDFVVTSKRLPQPGETVLGGAFTEERGGKGANQAVAAARASEGHVTMVGAVGDDAHGETAIRALTEDGIATQFIKRCPNTSTGVALILVDEQGENCISVASGANAKLTAADIEALPDAVFAESRVLLTNLETPIPAVATALRRAKQAGLLTILNPAPADIAIVQDDLLRYVDVLTPNELEAAALVGQSVHGVEGIDVAGRKLQQFGARTIVVTRGAAGCVFVDGTQAAAVIPARVVQAVDTTAAGDAFNGALAVALVEKRSFPDAVRWASNAASIAVTRLGAQPSLPHRHEIDVILGG
jgi:ribokinase